MNWETGTEGMSDAGYEHAETYSEVAATAAAEDRVVAVTHEEIIDIDTEDNLSITEIPFSGSGTIDDAAVGRGSYVFLVVDGELIPYSATGPVADSWAESVREVAALNDSKLVVVVLEDGTVRGFRAHNGLERFSLSDLAFDDRAMSPSIVAGRERFVVSQGDTLRYFDDRGTKQFETTFESSIRCVGFLSDSVLVSLESDRVLWIDEDGMEQRDTERELADVSACGERLLFGSANDAVTVYGQSGIVRQIIDESPGAIVQTSRDSYVGVIDGGELYLFRRRSPPTDVRIESSVDTEPELVVAAENPFPVSLKIDIEYNTGSNQQSESIFVPPGFNETTKIALPTIEPEDIVSIWVGSEDQSIVAFDDEVTYDPDDQPSAISEKDDAQATNANITVENPGSSSNDLVTQSGSDTSDSKLSNSGARDVDNSKKTSSGSPDEGDDESAEQPSAITNTPQSTSAQAPDKNAAKNRRQANDAEATSSIDERDSALSASCSLARIINGSYEWEVSVENTSNDPLREVNLEARQPVKLKFEGATTIGQLNPGEKITETAACPKDGPIEIAVTWVDSDDNSGESIIADRVISPKIDVKASAHPSPDSREADGNLADYVEFKIKNPLQVPIHDKLSVDTKKTTFKGVLNEQKITLNPGDNILTLRTSESLLTNSSIAGQFSLNLLWLGEELTADVTPPGDLSGDSDPNYRHDLFTYISEKEDTSNKPSLIKKHLDELDTSSPKNILVETITIQNNTDHPLSKGKLVTDSKDADEMDIRSLERGGKAIYKRYRQYNSKKNRVNTTTPEYELRGYANTLYIPNERVGVKISNPVPKVAIVKFGAHQDPKFFVDIEQGFDGPIELSQVTFVGGGCSIDIDGFSVSDRNSRRLFDLPESFDSQEFEGVVVMKFESDTFSFRRLAVVQEVQNPEVNEQWCDISTEATGDRDGVRVTIENVDSKQKVDDVVLSRVSSSDSDCENPHTVENTSVNELIHGQTVSLVCMPSPVEKSTGILLDLEATYGGDRTNTRISVVGDGESGWDWNIIPTEGNTDLSALADSIQWSDCLKTDWQYKSG